jgi:hypothetical protein
MLSIPPYAGIVVMSMLNKDKEFAGRIADINQQVQTGDVNFEQAGGQALDCNGCGGWLGSRAGLLLIVVCS